jgi:transcriptional regulator with XRE-family HTH domain
MDDHRIGTAFRAIRLRKHWRQQDVADAAGRSRWTVSRIERGRLDEITLPALRSVAAALDARLDLVLRWRGSDLDRLLNARHSQLHELLAPCCRSCQKSAPRTQTRACRAVAGCGDHASDRPELRYLVERPCGWAHASIGSP